MTCTTPRPVQGESGKYYLYIFQISLPKVAGSWELAHSGVLVFLSLLYKRVIERAVLWSAGKSIHPTNLHLPGSWPCSYSPFSCFCALSLNAPTLGHDFQNYGLKPPGPWIVMSASNSLFKCLPLMLCSR